MLYTIALVMELTKTSEGIMAPAKFMFRRSHFICDKGGEIMNIAAIFVLGAIGGMLRFAFAGNIYGTLFVNICGALCLGFFSTLPHLPILKPWIQNGITIGLIGSFTTFSSFATDALALSRHNIWFSGLYVATSIIGGLGLCYLGSRLADFIHPRVMEETRSR